MIAFIDPRSYLLGARVLCPEGMIELDNQAGRVKEGELWKEYDIHRIFNGFASGAGELKDRLPLNFNMVEINGVHFEKGCYLG